MAPELIIFYGAAFFGMLLLAGACIYGIWLFLIKKHAHGYLTLYLLCIFSIEIAAKYLMFNGQNNWGLIKHYNSVDFLLLSIFYLKSVPLTFRKSWITIYMAGNIVLFVSFFTAESNVIFWCRFFISLWFLSLCVYFIFNNIQGELKVPKSQRLLNLGVFIYYGSTLLIFYTLPYLFSSSISENLWLWGINLLLTFVFHFTFIRFFTLSKINK